MTMHVALPGTVAATPILSHLLWVQLWKTFRQRNYALHRRLGYLALTATALGSLSAAPYAVTYLFSGKMPEMVSAHHQQFCICCIKCCYLIVFRSDPRNSELILHCSNSVLLACLHWDELSCSVCCSRPENGDMRTQADSPLCSVDMSWWVQS